MKLESSATFHKSKEDENTHVLDTTAKLPKWRPRRDHDHSRPQRLGSFWSAPRSATSGQVQQRKSAIHGLPVALRMLRVKYDKSDWFWSQSIVFTNPFKTRMSILGADHAKGARPLGTRMLSPVKTRVWYRTQEFELENGLYHAGNARANASYMLCSTSRKST